MSGSRNQSKPCSQSYWLNESLRTTDNLYAMNQWALGGVGGLAKPSNNNTSPQPLVQPLEQKNAASPPAKSSNKSIKIVDSQPLSLPIRITSTIGNWFKNLFKSILNFFSITSPSYNEPHHRFVDDPTSNPFKPVGWSTASKKASSSTMNKPEEAYVSSTMDKPEETYASSDEDSPNFKLR